MVSALLRNLLDRRPHAGSGVVVSAGCAIDRRPIRGPLATNALALLDAEDFAARQSIVFGIGHKEAVLVSGQALILGRDPEPAITGVIQIKKPAGRKPFCIAWSEYLEIHSVIAD